jgi:hypothetical protein
LSSNFFLQRKPFAHGNLIYQADENIQISVISFFLEVKLFIDYVWKKRQEGEYEELKIYKSGESIMPPRHLLVVSWIKDFDKKKDSFNRIFMQIEELRKTDYLQEVIFVGDGWLNLDQDGVPKSQGDVNYFSYKKQLFKFLETAQHLEKYLKQSDLPPDLWVWVKDDRQEKLKNLLTVD